MEELDQFQKKMELLQGACRNIFTSADGELLASYLVKKYLQKPFCNPRDGFDKAGAEAIWRDGQRSVVEDLFKLAKEPEYE